MELVWILSKMAATPAKLPPFIDSRWPPARRHFTKHHDVTLTRTSASLSMNITAVKNDLDLVAGICIGYRPTVYSMKQSNEISALCTSLARHRIRK